MDFGQRFDLPSPKSIFELFVLSIANVSEIRGVIKKFADWTDYLSINHGVILQHMPQKINPFCIKLESFRLSEP